MAVRLKVKCDMDGVVADFEKRVQEHLGTDGRTYEATTGKSVWDFIIDYNDNVQPFFNTLDKMEDADSLWLHLTYLEHLGVIELEMLTSAGYGDHSEEFQRQKDEWFDHHFSKTHRVVFTTSGPSKDKYASPDALLIDDTLKNIEAFAAKGGKTIHHTSASDTISQINSMLGIYT
jgi:hypothetical protein